eukprot:GHVP01052885.1.p1 GENE.GHVP01052885.1~~GHVP01052885.1.p1  ORF type:complete len:360 (-),score=98.01 GHVP01052885.1:116-1195(-)
MSHVEKETEKPEEEFTNFCDLEGFEETFENFGSDKKENSDETENVKDFVLEVGELGKTTIQNGTKPAILPENIKKTVERPKLSLRMEIPKLGYKRSATDEMKNESKIIKKQKIVEEVPDSSPHPQIKESVNSSAPSFSKFKFSEKFKPSFLQRASVDSRSSMASELSVASKSETRRSSIASESETRRSSVFSESETRRSSGAPESETRRSSGAPESETRRSSGAPESETRRSSVASESASLETRSSMASAETRSSMEMGEEGRFTRGLSVKPSIDRFFRKDSTAISAQSNKILEKLKNAKERVEQCVQENVVKKTIANSKEILEVTKESTQTLRTNQEELESLNFSVSALETQFCETQF